MVLVCRRILDAVKAIGESENTNEICRVAREVEERISANPFNMETKFTADFLSRIQLNLE
jgi:hypothetical protein